MQTNAEADCKFYVCVLRQTQLQKCAMNNVYQHAATVNVLFFKNEAHSRRMLQTISTKSHSLFFIHLLRSNVCEPKAIHKQTQFATKHQVCVQITSTTDLQVLQKLQHKNAGLRNDFLGAKRTATRQIQRTSAFAALRMRWVLDWRINACRASLAHNATSCPQCHSTKRNCAKYRTKDNTQSLFAAL